RSPVRAATQLKREIVDLADAAVIQPGEPRDERQEVVVDVREPHACTTEERRDVRVAEMIQADFAREREKRRITFDGCPEVEMTAKRAGFTKLVIDEVVAGREGRKKRIA